MRILAVLYIYIVIESPSLLEHCHSECNEESILSKKQILHFVQNDKTDMNLIINKFVIPVSI
ncbi:hypothetical protein D0T56_02455 [Dysgonomonas sp. 520]|nr:hypothetical protein [Dysgonomonas sp. 520]